MYGNHVIVCEKLCCGYKGENLIDTTKYVTHFRRIKTT
jgi:hypothetical protein